MKQLFIQTPLLYSHVLSEHTGKEIYLKCESLQPSGSFKDRGIGELCEHEAAKSSFEFICASAGNAGLAVAYAAKLLNKPAVIVIPKTTPSLYVKKLEFEKAKVILEGENWDEANEFALKKSKIEGLTYIHPFDHPIIWQGYTSIIKEIQASDLKPDALIVSVGGGGLYSGLVQGCEEVNWKNVTMITAETEGAASFAASFRAKKRVRLEKIDTIAKTLGAKEICEQAFKWSQIHPTVTEVVTDQQAISACLHFANDHRQLVEPACGAALAVAYNRSSVLDPFHRIVIIVCGGSGVSLSLLNKWKMLL